MNFIDLANINGLKERRKKFNSLYSSFVSNPRPSNSILYSPVLLVTYHKDYETPELSTIFLFYSTALQYYRWNVRTTSLLDISIKIQGAKMAPNFI